MKIFFAFIAVFVIGLYSPEIVKYWKQNQLSTKLQNEAKQRQNHLKGVISPN